MADRNLNAALSSGTRQLQMPAIAARRPDVAGQQAQFDETERLVNELAGFGSILSEKAMKDNADTARTEAAIMVQQGKSLKEINESDDLASLQVFGETATMQGASAQRALIDMDTMKNDLIREIDEGKGAEMSTKDWRDYATARYNEALAKLPDGTSGRNLMADMGHKVLLEASEYHAKQNYIARQDAQLDATSASLFSAQNQYKVALEKGDKTLQRQAMADIQNRMVKPDGMKEEAHAELLTRLATDSLAFGDRTVYDEALKHGTFSPDQLAAMSTAEENYKQTLANKGSLQQSMDLAKIQSMAAQGVGASTIAAHIAQYNDKYSRTPITTGAAASLFNQSATSAVTAQRHKEVMAAQNAALAQGRDHLLNDKQGSATLEREMNRVGQGAEQDYMWATSVHDNKSLNNQMNNGMTVGNLIDPMGNPNPVAMDTFQKMTKYEQLNPNKAIGMLGKDEQMAYQMTRNLVDNGVPLAEAITKVGQGFQNRSANVAVVATPDFSGEDFGILRFGDNFGGLDDSDMTGVVDHATKQYKEYRKLGLSDYEAQELAKKDASRNVARVGDKLVDTQGINVQAVFHTPSADALVTNSMKTLRENPELATAIVGSAMGTAMEVADVQFVQPRGMLPQMRLTIKDKGTGESRAVLISGEAAKLLQAEQEVVTPVVPSSTHGKPVTAPDFHYVTQPQ